VCVILASVTIAVVDRMRASSPAQPPFDAKACLVIQLHEAKGYGNASMRVGTGPIQGFATNSAAVVETLKQEIQQAGCSCVLLRVSGGVRQGEVQRLHDILLRATAESRLTLYVALANEQPEDFGQTGPALTSEEESS
jgi:hypothetical protein